MRQWLAVGILGVVMSATGEAGAKRVACACPTRIVLPERGPQSLPLNTKIWVIDPQHGLQKTEPTLTANELYTDDNVSFTPGSEIDDIAPAPPRDISAYIAVRFDTWNVETISLFGQYAPDTALVRIAIKDDRGHAEIVTTPTRLFMCQPDIRAGVGEVQLMITALDIAGNESEPLRMTVKTTPIAGTDDDVQCADGVAWGRHRRGHGFEILFFILLVPITLVAWAVLVLWRRATVKSHVAEPISLLEAEALMRRLSRWQVVWSAMLIGTAIAMQLARDLNDVAIVLAPWIFSSLGQLFLQRRALRLLDRQEADAARRGPWLVVTTLQDSVTVRASDADFVAAKRSSIPRSIAK